MDFKRYVEVLDSALEALDLDAIERLAGAIEEAYRSGHFVYIIGNDTLDCSFEVTAPDTVPDPLESLNAQVAVTLSRLMVTSSPLPCMNSRMEVARTISRSPS